MSEVTMVPVKSAWASKINWTQGVSLVASILAIKGVDLDPNTQAAIVLGIQGVQATATWVFRTWFNKSVSPASM